MATAVGHSQTIYPDHMVSPNCSDCGEKSKIHRQICWFSPLKTVCPNCYEKRNLQPSSSCGIWQGSCSHPPLFKQKE